MIHLHPHTHIYSSITTPIKSETADKEFYRLSISKKKYPVTYPDTSIIYKSETLCYYRNSLDSLTELLHACCMDYARHFKNSLPNLKNGFYLPSCSTQPIN
jgi:hypothetical protein